MTAPRHERYERAVQMYMETSKTAEQIAEELGVSRSTVYGWLAQAGVTGSRRAQGPAPSLDLTGQIVQGLEDVREALSRMAVDERWQAAFDLLTAMREELIVVKAETQTNRATIASLDATVNRLVGAVETLVTMRQPPPTGPQFLSTSK